MAEPNQTKTLAVVDGTKPIMQAGGVGAFGLLLKARQKSIGDVAASFMSPERIIKVSLNNFSKNPALLKCTGDSVFRAILMAAELGLEPGGALGEAHLVPYGSECTFIVDYKGLVQLMYRSGVIKSVNTGAVYEGDIFEEEYGLAPKLRHVKGDGPRDPANLTNVWAVVLLKDGGQVFDSMKKSEVDKIRVRSRAGNNGPWVTDYEAMARKTVLKRLSKLVPKSKELTQALAYDNEGEGYDPRRQQRAEVADLNAALRGSVPVPDAIEAEIVPVSAKPEPGPFDGGPEWDGPAVEVGEE